MSQQTTNSNESENARPEPKPLSWWLSNLISVCVIVGSGIFVIFLAGVAQRVGWFQRSGGQSTTVATEAHSEIHTCPMHPQIRQPGTGRCPICGMELVPAAAAGAVVDEMAVRIEPSQRRLANIQTEVVTFQSAERTIRTIGAIQIDESRQAIIPSYISGRVERLFADYTGVDVRKGDHLAVIYSPEIFKAQVEYINARDNIGQDTLPAVQQIQEKLVESSRQKLLELGTTEEQLEMLDRSGKAQSRLTIFTKIGGTVIEKFAEEGKYISAGEPIYRIANLSTVWLMLELYPEDASQIRFGQRVEGELQSLPGEILTGRVAYIDRTVDLSTRTVGVRVEFDNRDRRLRPGDYAHATVHIPIGPKGDVYDQELAGKWISPMHPQVIEDGPGDCSICGMKLVPTSRFGYSDTPVDQPKALMIPRSALLLAGESSVVYVETEIGRFEIRNVVIGPILRDRVIILSGVKEGERVATAGNFLIDSQMQLAGNPSLIDPTRAIVSEFRNTPLQFTSLTIESVQGALGVQVERLFESYFSIQKSLAADQSPRESDVETLSRMTESLSKSSVRTELLSVIEEIARHTEHLNHLPLKEARKQFKRLSHGVVTLATLVRGDKATAPFHQFFCPMVPEGEGDWLQSDVKLVNPYFGVKMLTCGKLVRSIPAPQTEPSKAPGLAGGDKTDPDPEEE